MTVVAPAAMSDAAGSAVIGLLISTPVFEDFFGSIGISRAEYLRAYDNDWICYYTRVLAAQGFRLRWYLFSRAVRRPESARHEPTGAEVRFLPAARLYNWWTVRLPWIHHFSAYYATMASSLIGELRRRPPAVLYVQDYESGRFDVASVVAASLRIPVLGQYHGGHSPARRPLGGLRRWAIRRAGGILAPNREEYCRVRDAYILGERAAYLPHPVPPPPPPSSAPAVLKGALGLAPSARYVLFVGRLDAHHKGVDVLLAAFRLVAERFPDTHLVIVGRGPDRAALEAVARALPRVHFLGWEGSRTRIADLMSAADVVACPSRFEAFCYVAAEAMAAGRPVVASAVGGLRDLVADGHTGFLVPPGDARALATALANVLDDRGAVAALGGAGRERFERELSETVVGPRLVEVIRLAIGRSRPR